MALGLVAAVPASASFEQVATFGEGGVGGLQLNGAKAMAVNTTGAGGVPAGTVYVASRRNLVARYAPNGDFLAAWGWAVAPAGERSGGYERCGSAGEASHPTCGADGIGGDGLGQFYEPNGIAVDQATGNVYVMNQAFPSGGQDQGMIQVFSPDGSQILAKFGGAAAFTEPFDVNPQLIRSNRERGLAVDNSGVVYVLDRKVGTSENPGNDFRIMTFEPENPGQYEKYRYAGRSSDIDTNEVALTGLAVDDSANLYTTGENEVREFSPGQGANPVCEFQIPTGGVGPLAVDPATGEPFVFNTKDSRIHLLSPCSQGQFQETGTVTVSPKPLSLSPLLLAIAPGVEWDSNRPAGILYAVDSAERAGGSGLGHIYAHPAVLPPVIEAEEASSITASAAFLKAKVNPKGSNTSYAFQYITAAGYEANPPSERFSGASQAPLGGGTLFASPFGTSVGVAVGGLAADTEYRYRVIATSHCETTNPLTICESVGGDQAFSTYPAGSPQPTDGRGYELVTPAEKNGGEPWPLRPEISSCGDAVECKPGANGTAYPRVVATDGESIAYQGFPFSSTQGAANYNGYVSERTGGGWQTLFSSPPLMGTQDMGYQAFSSDLADAIISQGTGVTLSPLAPPGYGNLYLQRDANPGALTPLLTTAPPNRPNSGATSLLVKYAGASADFSRIFFEANDALTDATGSAPAAVDGGASKFNLYEWHEGQLSLVNVAPGNATTEPGAELGIELLLAGSLQARVLTNAVSNDGRRAFWSSESGQVFVRIDGAKTEEIPDPGKFLAASVDGSAVLLDDGHLYDLETKSLSDLTEGHGGFEGVLGQSDNLSRIYFADTAVLTEEENHAGEKAEAGKPNLYLWQEGQLVFIRTLLPSDNKANSRDWVAPTTERTAQASPDGRWLAFLSAKSLTGHNNVGACGAALAVAPCSEAYLFDASTGDLICASCSPTGQPPIGIPAHLPTINGVAEQPQYIDDTGRLYFNSQDSLALGDTNGRVEDVYEYEPDGVGSCRHANGCIALISAGTGASDSDFLGVDESGKNVFFTTRDRLVSQDRDELIDVYDAREGGGFPGEDGSASGECTGEACQSPSPPPAEPRPGSAGIAGSGGGKATCKKGQVRRKGKCVKKAKHAAHHKKAHHKKAKHGKGKGAGK
jgi:DNA-binding beta-propeller fold protein YncE